MKKENNSNEQQHLDLKVYRNSEMPFDIGGLEKDDFSYLGEWKTITKPGDNFGFYYKMGIKQGILDSDNVPATAFLHFIAPYVPKGQKMSDEMQSSIDATVNTMIQVSTIRFSQQLDNAIGLRVDPTNYMLEELNQLIGNYE